MNSLPFALLPFGLEPNLDFDEENAECYEQMLTEAERQLIHAVKSKNAELVEEILCRELCDLNLNAHILHTTPLCLAASNGSLEICHLLLNAQHGEIDIDRTNACGETPLLLSIKNCHAEVAEMLIKHGATVNIPEPAGTIASPLFNAVWKGRIDLVELLVQHGCDVNKGSSRNSPLLMAARLGWVDITRILLNADCDKNWRNRFGVTALYESVIRGNLPGVKMLLEAGCDPNLSDKYGKTPLHVLAQEYYAHGTLDNVAILDLLLSHDSCDVSLEDKAGDKVGDLAVQCNKPWVLRPLLMRASQKDCRVHRCDAASQALHSGLFEVAKLLLQAHPCHVIEETAESLLRLQSDATLASMLIQCGACLPAGLSRSIFVNFHYPKVLTLQAICRKSIRKFLKWRTLWAIHSLTYPKALKEFLLFHSECGVAEGGKSFNFSMPYDQYCSH